MLKKTVMGILFAGVLAAGAFGQEVVVRVHPPRAVVERRVPAPGPGYVWVGGYQRWDGNAYVWVPGRWDRPPRPHARWVAHHWVHRHGGWVMVEGHWR
ncbi:MAG TPA: YXWGXW repeat-containing protein [Bryobacteraceae bacterium]|nr:YXWGXW repeat-containing protein [Bryobacteraceae bacterium]